MKLYGADPPAAASVCVYATLTLPDGKGEPTASRSPVVVGWYVGIRSVPDTLVAPSFTVTVASGVNPVTATVELEKKALPSMGTTAGGEPWITPAGPGPR